MRVTRKRNKNEKRNLLKNKIKSPEFKESLKNELVKFFATVIFTLIYGIGMGSFLMVSSTRLYSGGVPGIAQLFIDFLHLIKVSIPEGKAFNEAVLVGIMVFVLNVPILILGWFGVSKKFVLYSILSVIIQSTVIGYMTTHIFEKLDTLMLSIMGGILIGIGAGGALKYGTSTGGFDIVGQYYARKTGKSVGSFVTYINIGLAVVGSVFIYFTPDRGKDVAAQVLSFTTLRLLITMIVMDKVHTSYKFMEINVISNYSVELVEEIVNKFGRGVTVIDVKGGYGYNEKQLVYVVIFSYEVRRFKKLVKSIDTNAFIVVKRIENIFGNFKKKVI